MRSFCADARGSPTSPRARVANGPTFPPVTSACVITPTRPRGELVSLRYGVVNALYVMYTSVPLGEIAGAV